MEHFWDHNSKNEPLEVIEYFEKKLLRNHSGSILLSTH